ncbi:MAG: hypothetical protein QXO98_05835 [Sulfolobales archaeon]
MVKVLITNATIVTLSRKHDLIINNGYVFINDGVIRAVGSGEVPEELQYPELLISGRGRVVIPGISSGYTKVSTYPIRHVLHSLGEDKVFEYLSTLSRVDVYYSAVLAFTDLLYRGVTSMMISDIYLDDVARAANDVGVSVVLASPLNIKLRDYDPHHELKLIMQRWHNRVDNVLGAIAFYGDLRGSNSVLDEYPEGKVFVIGADDLNSLKNLGRDNVIAIDPIKESPAELNIIRTHKTLGMWKPFQGFGIGDSATYDVFDMLRVLARSGRNGLDLLYSAATNTASMIGLDNLSCIEEGKKANIVIYNFTEPPAWPLINSIEAVTNALIMSELKVETAIVGDNVLVDSGEVLSVGADLIKKATTRLESIIRGFIK